MRIVYWLLNLLFPPKCILCRHVLRDQELDLCRSCRVDAPEYPAGMIKKSVSDKNDLHFLDSFTAVWYYEGYVRRSILRYKFRRARNLAGGFGRLLAMKIRSDYADGFDLISFVPVSPQRRRKRGYDQAELLAAAAGSELGMKYVRVLKKIRNNPPQSGTSGAHRKANVLGAYRVESEDNVRGKRILLVDDVLTTGATADECARMLMTAGAAEVRCAVLATPRKKNKPSR